MSKAALDLIAYIQREIARSGIDLGSSVATGEPIHGGANFEEGVNIDEADVTEVQLHQASAPSMGGEASKQQLPEAQPVPKVRV